MNNFDRLPKPADRRIAMRVKPAAERALRAGHPWLFEEAIRSQSHDGRPGDLAVIYDRKDRFLAIGLYDPEDAIRVRVLQHNRAAPINTEWFRDRLSAAAVIRQQLIETATNGYRLVHGENDGLPALIIDRYVDDYVIKLYSAAWLPHLPDVVAALNGVMPVRRLILRLSRSLTARKDLLYGLAEGQLLSGPTLERPALFMENGLTFEADLFKGQKTGFFLDQRENRARVEALIRGAKHAAAIPYRPLNRVLNVFAYSGGFSVYAARGGAQSFLDVDASRAALAAARRHFDINGSIPAFSAAVHETRLGDAFQVLEALKKDNKKYDLVIIDPPAFAKNQAEVDQALKAYRRLVSSGLAVLQTDGVLVMASCSSRVNEEAFFSTVHQAAHACGRRLQELERSGHPIDHPVGFPQGAYLKCLFAVAP